MLLGSGKFQKVFFTYGIMAELSARGECADRNIQKDV